jgi:flagellar hook-length control protein FliK
LLTVADMSSDLLLSIASLPVGPGLTPPSAGGSTPGEDFAPLLDGLIGPDGMRPVCVMRVPAEPAAEDGTALPRGGEIVPELPFAPQPTFAPTLAVNGIAQEEPATDLASETVPLAAQIAAPPVSSPPIIAAFATTKPVIVGREAIRAGGEEASEPEQPTGAQASISRPRAIGTPLGQLGSGEPEPLPTFDAQEPGEQPATSTASNASDDDTTGPTEVSPPVALIVGLPTDVASATPQAPAPAPAREADRSASPRRGIGPVSANGIGLRWTASTAPVALSTPVAPPSLADAVSPSPVRPDRPAVPPFEVAGPTQPVASPLSSPAALPDDAQDAQVSVAFPPMAAPDLASAGQVASPVAPQPASVPSTAAPFDGRPATAQTPAELRQARADFEATPVDTRRPSLRPALLPPTIVLPAGQAFGAALQKAWAAERKPVARLAEAVSFTASQTSPTAPTMAEPVLPALDTADHGWPQAMVERIERLQDAADATSTRIRLLPDALGAIDVAVRREGELLHVQFTAAEAQTRQLLADAQPRLAEAADARGLRLGRADVSGGDLSGQHSGTGERQQRPPSSPSHPTRPAAPRAPDRADPTDTRIA